MNLQRFLHIKLTNLDLKSNVEMFFRVKEVDTQSHTLLPDLEWNPRSIYQTIIQQEETETGVRSDKDLNASVDECLKHDKVREILDKNLNTLSRLVEGKIVLNRLAGFSEYIH